MNAKLFLTIILIFLSTFLSSFSFAEDPYSDIYPVDSLGSFTKKDVFTLSERPWLYLRFEDKDATSPILNEGTVTKWTWDNPSGSDLTYPRSHSGATQNSVWIGFSESYWNSIAKSGDWAVEAKSDIDLPDGSSKSFAGLTTFNVKVIPEPVGTLLFLAGSLAFLALRKKKI